MQPSHIHRYFDVGVSNPSNNGRCSIREKEGKKYDYNKKN